MGKKKARKTEFEKLAEDVAGRHSKRMNSIMLTQDDENFTLSYFKLLEYAQPKLQRTDVNASVEVDKITIKRVDIPLEEVKEDE